ncbi:unnamed protein product [Prorocentrum cordatum]|uniref:SH3 domain-containing protein n=1 Tax=Prorocentrum cordatum TaxID=2364126 RepID=A0ABN9W5G8_9DINO|nr:unnamed protein product [Polarella glacialis]
MVTHREGMWQLAKLASRSRMARRVEYCAFHFYAFDPAEARLTAAQEPEAPPQAPQPRQEWSFSTPPRDRPAPAAAAPPGARGGPPRGAPPAEGHRRRWGALTDPAAGSAEVFAMEEALAATLARGHGRVAVARSRDRRGAPRREAAAALRQWCGAAAPWPLAPSAPRRGARLWCTPGVRGADERVPDGEVVELLSCPQPSEGGLGDFVRVRRGGGDEGWVKVEHVRLAG